MQHAQPPAVAGLFYTDNAQRLRTDVEAFVRSGRSRTTEAITPRPRAIIAPHAGYQYSGPIAGSAYAPVAAHAAGVHRVLLIGPAHRYPVRGLASSSASSFETPLGRVPVDRSALDSLAAELPQVSQIDAAFNGEHCLEVQLPFLQVLLDHFDLVPLLVGAASGEQVAEVLERFWGNGDLIVISSDLSHYLEYHTAQRLDQRTSHAICTLHPEQIAPEQACGQPAIGGLLRVAKAHGAEARVLDLRNSGDTAGPRDRVVGYGAYVFG